MNEVDIGSLDLNLLVVLDVLLQEHNVTRAAKRLFRTQSAVSHALGRLRVQLGDPILVRMGGEMRPTPRAERIAPEVARLLRAIGRVLAQEDAFDPATSDRVFSIAGPDFVAAALPDLLVRLAGSPVGVELAPAGPGMLRDVANGRVDLAVSPGSARADGLRAAPLGELDWVVYARRGHPGIRGWGRRAWSKYPHVQVRTGSRGEGPVDLAARAQGITRRIGPYLPHFSLAPPLLSRSDLLLTVPRATLMDVAERFELVALPCPVKLAPVALSLYWSAALDQDPALVWFRERAEEALSRLFAPEGGEPASRRGAGGLVSGSSRRGGGRPGAARSR